MLGLGPHVFTAKGLCSIPGQGTKTPQAAPCGAPKKKKRKKEKKSSVNGEITFMTWKALYYSISSFQIVLQLPL